MSKSIKIESNEGNFGDLLKAIKHFRSRLKSDLMYSFCFIDALRV